jgi:hypothetical protein
VALGAGLPLPGAVLPAEVLPAEVLPAEVLPGAGLPGAGLLGDGLGDGEVTEVGRLTRQLGLGLLAGNALASPSAIYSALFSYPAEV